MTLNIFKKTSMKCLKAVVIASVITDRLCIQQGIHNDLSAHNLLSCCDNCCGCRGGNVLNAWKYVKEEGLVTGGSYGSKKVRILFHCFLLMIFNYEHFI